MLQGYHGTLHEQSWKWEKWVSKTDYENEGQETGFDVEGKKEEEHPVSY